MSAIIFSVSSMIAMKATCRSTMAPSASAISVEKAAIAAFQIDHIGRRAAGDRVDQPARIERRQHVGQCRQQHGAMMTAKRTG